VTTNKEEYKTKEEFNSVFYKRKQTSQISKSIERGFFHFP